MFTGIIRHLGKFEAYRLGRRQVVIAAPAELAAALTTGASLAVNGVCLSLAGRDRDRLTFDLSRETLERTTLGGLKPGDVLNLEPPLSLQDPLGGHLVTGHVDGTGKVLRVWERPPGKRLRVSFEPDLRPYLAPKGSVALDGVSLTVAALDGAAFEVELIPLTLAQSNLGRLRPGRPVNIECDIIGKYVYNYILQQPKRA